MMSLWRALDKRYLFFPGISFACLCIYQAVLAAARWLDYQFVASTIADILLSAYVGGLLLWAFCSRGSVISRAGISLVCSTVTLVLDEPDLFRQLMLEATGLMNAQNPSVHHKAALFLHYLGASRHVLLITFPVQLLTVGAMLWTIRKFGKPNVETDLTGNDHCTCQNTSNFSLVELLILLFNLGLALTIASQFGYTWIRVYQLFDGFVRTSIEEPYFAIYYLIDAVFAGVVTVLALCIAVATRWRVAVYCLAALVLAGMMAAVVLEIGLPYIAGKETHLQKWTIPCVAATHAWIPGVVIVCLVFAYNRLEAILTTLFGTVGNEEPSQLA